MSLIRLMFCPLVVIKIFRTKNSVTTKTSSGIIITNREENLDERETLTDLPETETLTDISRPSDGCTNTFVINFESYFLDVFLIENINTRRNLEVKIDVLLYSPPLSFLSQYVMLILPLRSSFFSTTISD